MITCDGRIRNYSRQAADSAKDNGFDTLASFRQFRLQFVDVRLTGNLALRNQSETSVINSFNVLYLFKRRGVKSIMVIMIAALGFSNGKPVP